MAQPVHFAQGHMVQCTLLDHPTPHQKHPQKRAGAKQKQGQKIQLGDVGQPQMAQDISNAHWGQHPEKYYAGSQKQAEAQEHPGWECDYDYDHDAHP
jgi:hypothetical protein